eukprot:11653787-Prorocentrum_lima.AAC.1
MTTLTRSTPAACAPTLSRHPRSGRRFRRNLAIGQELEQSHALPQERAHTGPAGCVSQHTIQTNAHGSTTLLVPNPRELRE